jgi:hypothetical protein
MNKQAYSISQRLKGIGTVLTCPKMSFNQFTGITFKYKMLSKYIDFSITNIIHSNVHITYEYLALTGITTCGKIRAQQFDQNESKSQLKTMNIPIYQIFTNYKNESKPCIFLAQNK